MSGLSDALNIQPDFDRYGQAGFAQSESAGRQLLAVMVEGIFNSSFQGKTSPLIEEARQQQAELVRRRRRTAPAKTTEDEGRCGRRLCDRPGAGRIPGLSRIILLASNTFLADASLELASGAGGTRYLNPLQLVANCIDWSLEDRDLLSIRGRGHFARTLLPMDKETRMLGISQLRIGGLRAC